MLRFNPEALSRYIKDSGLSYKSTNRSWVLNCPRCGKKDKLWILKSSGIFKCWSCDTFKGRADRLLKEIVHEPLSQIRNNLYGTRNISYEEFNALIDDLDSEDFSEESITIPIIDPPPGAILIGEDGAEPGQKYLEGRGIPVDIAKYYGIWYWPEKKSVVFPLTYCDELVGYQRRVTYDTVFTRDGVGKRLIKAVSSENLPRDKVLMFQDKVDSDYVVLCEGPIDAIKCHQFGNGVCTMGKEIQDGQIEALRRKGIKKVYLTLDPDAYNKIRGKLIDRFKGIEVYIVMINKKDIGSMSFEEAKKAIESSEKFSYNKIYFAL